MTDHAPEIALLKNIFPTLGEVTFRHSCIYALTLTGDRFSVRAKFKDGTLSSHGSLISDYEALAIVKQWLMDRLERPCLNNTSDNSWSVWEGLRGLHSGATPLEALHKAWSAIQ